MNLRPSGYEPDELPGCSTPRHRGHLQRPAFGSWVSVFRVFVSEALGSSVPYAWKTWQRPTLPRLETKYHRRRGFSPSSSGWDRVFRPRHNHQVIQNQRAPLSRGQSDETREREPFNQGLIRKFLKVHRRLRIRALKPIEQLVPVSFTHCCASTPGLSTWWSTTVLKGNMVSRWVSRLDAFSGYPVRT